MSLTDYKTISSGTVLKATPIDGNPNSIGIITGTQEPFDKKFLSNITVSGSIIQPAVETYAFHVEKNDSTKNQLLSNGLVTTLTWGTEIYDFGNRMNISTLANSNFYIAPYTGLYQFNAHVLIEDTGDYTTNDRMDLRFYYGSGGVSSLSDFHTFLFIVGETTNNNQFRSLHGSTQIYLTSGQRVALKVYNGTGVNQNTYNGTGNWVRFEGRMVRRFDV